MGIKSKIKKNVVKTELSSMKLTIAGRPKSGKTSMFYEILKRGDGLDSGLLIAFEKGYNFLDGLNVVDISSWKDFVDVLTELEKDNEGFKYVCIDTIDVAIQMCQEAVLKKQSAKDGQRYESLPDLAYGKGYSLLETEFSNQMARVDRIFGGWLAITHDRDREIEERSGIKYNKTTMSASGKAGEYMRNSSDFIVFIDIVKEKVRDSKTRQTTLEESRLIRLRGDGTTEAGGRIKNLPETIPYDIDLLLETIEKAVKEQVHAQSKGVTKKPKKVEAKEEVKKEVVVEEQEESVEIAKVDIDDVKAKIADAVSKMSATEKREIAKVFKSTLGVIDFKKSDDVVALTEVLESL